MHDGRSDRVIGLLGAGGYSVPVRGSSKRVEGGCRLLGVVGACRPLFDGCGDLVGGRVGDGHVVHLCPQAAQARHRGYTSTERAEAQRVRG